MEIKFKRTEFLASISQQTKDGAKTNHVTQSLPPGTTGIPAGGGWSRRWIHKPNRSLWKSCECPGNEENIQERGKIKGKDGSSEEYQEMEIISDLKGLRVYLGSYDS